jgi:hypothetical protein
MRTLACILALLAVAGCDDKKGKPPAAAPVAAPAAGSAAAPPPAVRPDEVPAAAGAQVEQIFAQLEAERTHRPPVTPTVEAVYAAIETAGVTFDEKKQVLGLSVGASYCMRAGNTTNGLNVVVCEYETAAKAKTGIELVNTKFADLSPTRTFTTKGSTTIQVIDRPTKPLTDVRRTIDAALATL